MAYKIFISYSTRDLPIVNHVKQLLTNAPIEVYVADYSMLPSTVLDEAIINAIESSDLLFQRASAKLCAFSARL